MLISKNLGDLWTPGISSLKGPGQHLPMVFLSIPSDTYSVSDVLQVNGLISVSTTLTWVIWIPPKGRLNLNGTKSPTALHKECMSFKKGLKKLSDALVF